MEENAEPISTLKENKSEDSLPALMKMDNSMTPDEIKAMRIFRVQDDYDYKASTEENYADDSAPFVGMFKKVRNELDYEYHRKYKIERQLFQDALIENFLNTIVKDKDNANVTCDHPTENWIVFTAGPMGAGKGRTINWLAQEGLFPMSAFVNVDPDVIRGMLPEFEGYNDIDPLNMGWRTQKEVGYISELLTYRALDVQKNVLVDGSLRDKHWYHTYFCNLRNRFPILKIAILHVTAKSETVLERASKRAEVTGRVVPREAIIDSMVEIPRSLEVLSPVTDLVGHFENEKSSPPEPLLLNLTMRGFDRSQGDDALNKSKLLWTMKLSRYDTEDTIEQQSYVEQSTSEAMSEGSIHGDGAYELEHSLESTDNLPLILEKMDSQYSTSMKMAPRYLLHDFEQDMAIPVQDWKAEFSIIWQQKCEIPSVAKRAQSVRMVVPAIQQRTPFARGFSVTMNVAGEEMYSDSASNSPSNPAATDRKLDRKPKFQKAGSVKVIHSVLQTYLHQDTAKCFGSVNQHLDDDMQPGSTPTPALLSTSETSESTTSTVSQSLTTSTPTPTQSFLEKHSSHENNEASDVKVDKCSIS